MRKKLGAGELEALVMDVLWSQADAMTPGEVHAALKRRRVLAYTTVMTILVRLWEKGMIEREREGRAFSYRPVLSRDEWAAARMREILDAAGDPKGTLTHFVKAIDPGAVRQLRKLLERPPRS